MGGAAPTSIHALRRCKAPRHSILAGSGIWAQATSPTMTCTTSTRESPSTICVVVTSILAKNGQ